MTLSPELDTAINLTATAILEMAKAMGNHSAQLALLAATLRQTKDVTAAHTQLTLLSGELKAQLSAIENIYTQQLTGN